MNYLQLFFRFLIICFIFLCPWHTLCQGEDLSIVDKPILRVAVIKLEDPYFWLDCFGPTMEHLRESLPEYKIVSSEVPFEDAEISLQKGNFDFLISPSGIYASLSGNLGLRQIATRKFSDLEDASFSVGSTFVALKEAKDINQIKDLKGKVGVTNEANSLSGWLSAEGEILQNGFSPINFFSNVLFLNYAYPDVLTPLLSGKADVAILPVCELEKKFVTNPDLVEKLKIVNSKHFVRNCTSSTELYPDVVFSSFPSVSDKAVKAITLSLFSMPKGVDGSEWSVASDFRKVINLFKDLKIGPYKETPFDFRKFLIDYQKEVIVSVFILLGLLLHILRVNHLVQVRTSELRQALIERDKASRAAKESLLRLNRIEKRGLVSQLSNMMVHELKQPLASISNYSNGLRKYLAKIKSSDNVLKEAINGIQEGSQQAVNIVEYVRNYVKSENSASHSECNLTEVAQRTFLSFRSSSNTEASLQGKFGLTGLISANPLEVEVMILNLLKNAADAIVKLGAKGTIRCVTSAHGSIYTVYVEDNGPKIADATLERMKHALQNSLKPQGLGLGLSIVLGVAEKYGAQVNFQQIEPQGLRVQISFKVTT